MANFSISLAIRHPRKGSRLLELARPGDSPSKDEKEGEKKGGKKNQGGTERSEDARAKLDVGPEISVGGGPAGGFRPGISITGPGVPRGSTR